MIGYGLLVSLSRGSWVGFAVGFAIVALARHRRALWALPAAAVPGLLLFGAQLSRYAEHFLKAVYAQDQATGMRLGEYKDALTLIQQNPWLGVGFGGTPSSDLYLGVSSTYLMVAEEMGLLGLLAFLLALATRPGGRGARPTGALPEADRAARARLPGRLRRRADRGAVRQALLRPALPAHLGALLDAGRAGRSYRRGGVCR